MASSLAFQRRTCLSGNRHRHPRFTLRPLEVMMEKFLKRLSRRVAMEQRLSPIAALEFARDGAEAGKTKAEAKTRKTERATKNDKAKVMPKEEDAKRDVRVYVFVFVFGGTAWVMVDNFKDKGDI
ncbi:hypothetical protein LWI28_011669 [Acer negundo]|uniref:Uncharacterized protein n=1 Tax=Acer negundo TaxID=4023 RepID=A0AAD5IYX5_ACENE|nr:hypothetical protein LWI28_011669 [Acer negundo]KAK4849440.1 hypothetical protein QYF36_024831 [Acer negundo]